MIDKMRDQFVDWYNNYPHFEQIGSTRDAAWIAWKASRDCIDVELPFNPENYTGKDELPRDVVAMRAACKSAIEAQGLRVKS